MKGIFKDIFSVFFPKYCLGCNTIINDFEDFLCVECSNKLKETNFHLLEKNPLYHKFFGKITLSCATALLYFQKQGVTQYLIHHLKYHKQENIGQWLGKWLGNRLQQSPYYQHIDTVIPVPIHPKKLKIRGYNQVELFARELALSLNATYVDNVLIKTHSNTAQAKKHWFERQKDNQNLFTIQNTEKIIGKNILLIDDVITTGATIEVCANALLQAERVTIGIACMAYVENE